MELKPIHIVDTLAVTPANRKPLLKLLKERGIPVMQRAGLALVGLHSTSPDLDEEVLIQVTWSIADHSVYNLARKAFVTDPEWWAYSADASRLWHGGNRRFFYPAPLHEVE